MSALPPEVIAADLALSNRPPRQSDDDEEPIQFSAEEVRREKQAAEQRRRKRAEELWEKRDAAMQILIGWARAHAKRNDVIRAAHDAGISVHQIHRITGIARTTITRILEEQQ